MPKGVSNKRYAPEFKKPVIETILDNGFEKIPDDTHPPIARIRTGSTSGCSIRRASGRGSCLNNAVIENIFGLLKIELLCLQGWKPMERFKQESLTIRTTATAASRQN